MVNLTRPCWSFRAGVVMLAAAGLSLLAVPTARAATPPTSAPAATNTLQNLQAAFNGESNAHARYLAFAEKADAEGFAGAASLFRAAARAEQTHAAAHSAVITKMGGKPTADVKAAEVKTTAENLKAAIEGESYERDTMYPDFLKQARVEKNKAALQSFTYAKTAEAEHAKLYAQALQNLDGWKTARTFYVCQVCGYTTTQLDFAKCISCFSGKDKYDAVS